MGYLAELMSTNEEVSKNIHPLPGMCRGYIDRMNHLDMTLLRWLEEDSATGRPTKAVGFCLR
jgi:hypothetical protein